jgi:hypothetical protein
MREDVECLLAAFIFVTPLHPTGKTCGLRRTLD